MLPEDAVERRKWHCGLSRVPPYFLWHLLLPQPMAWAGKRATFFVSHILFLAKFKKLIIVSGTYPTARV